jgi:type I restriction enzyme M protein
MSLSTTIKSIQDIMRKDVGVDGDAQRISQLVWLLFLKIFDAQEEEMEATRDDYHSPLPEKLRWRNWAADAEGITGDALHSLCRKNGSIFHLLRQNMPQVCPKMSHPLPPSPLAARESGPVGQ